jgi:ribose transport system substrate-binding protein
MPRIDEATPVPTRPPFVGLGPHGERPAGPEAIGLSPEALRRARDGAYRIAVVLHTTTSDWSKRQIAGIRAGLAEAGAAVVEVIGCDYDAATQVKAIERLVREKPDAVISIPFGGSAVSRAFRGVSAAGIKLILLDNAPSGLRPEADYVSVVSSDNFGLGQIAASLLSPHVPSGGSVGIVAYKIDFFATAQREIAFSKWMRRERPDIALTQMKFDTPAQSGLVVGPYLDGHPDLDGLFVVWDEPAAETVREISRRSRRPAMTTVDLGKTVADALIRGDIVKGVAAQRPFEQGHAAAIAAVAALTGQLVPPWIVLPGLSVTAANVVDAYRTVGGEPASPALMAAAETT